MGRYSAPQFDLNSEDVGENHGPMDWVAIPDDDDSLDAHDVPMDDIRSKHTSSKGSIRQHEYRSNEGLIDDSNGNDTSGGLTNVWSMFPYASLHTRDVSDANVNHEDNSNNGRNNSFTNLHSYDESQALNDISGRDAILLAQQFIRHSNFMQQQYLEAKNERRRRSFILTSLLVLILGMVLKRHAPPPPPMFNHYFAAIVETGASTNVENFSSNFLTTNSIKESQFAGGIPNGQSKTIVTQHDDWESYCRCIFFDLYHTCLQLWSVSWYAVSNAVCYAAEEVRDMLIDLLQRLRGALFDGVREVDDDIISIKDKRSNSNCLSRTYWKVRVLAWTRSIQKLQKEPNNEMEQDTNPSTINLREGQSTDRQLCSIILPAARIHHSQLPRGAVNPAFSNSILEGLSSEEFMHQLGAFLAPQSLALKLVAEGISSWGEEIVESAPASSVHRMVTGSSYESQLLPPAKGMLFVGPEGVGKMHVARRLARLLFGHCTAFDENVGSNPSCPASSQGESCFENTKQPIDLVDFPIDGALEIFAEDVEDLHAIKGKIVDHVKNREGRGSMIIIHHIEHLPTSMLSDLSQILSGKSNLLSYSTAVGPVEAKCNGTLFVFTSKQWGTKSIFQQIQWNGGMSRLHREPLISSIKREFDSNLDYRNSLANHITTIAPFLPLQKFDIFTAMRFKIDRLDKKYRGIRWKHLIVSNRVLDYFVGTDHVEYFDLVSNTGDDETAEVLLTFSTTGAGALDDNSLMNMLSSKLLAGSRGSRLRQNKIASVDFDESNLEIIFSWCEKNDDDGVPRHCEEEWRSAGMK